jgi:hypothetical protein
MVTASRGNTHAGGEQQRQRSYLAEHRLCSDTVAKQHQPTQELLAALSGEELRCSRPQ